ncbi:MAG: SpoIIE family protein phosphatase, partial [Acidobacteria bacterium]|nr:SpoIIE family protein phosphatase [Acidobacteriota bacterium]
MASSDLQPGSLQTEPQSLPLTVIGPTGERRRVLVDRSPFRIGRLPDRELTLKDGRISRDHAQILLEDGQYFIEDVNSRHGVFVNGRKAARAPLRRRDRIDFGIEDSYCIYVGDAPAFQTPLLQKVAALPGAPESAGNLTRLSAVLDVARTLESSGNVDDVLAAAVDAALAITKAERGFLMLKNERGELEIRVARDDQGQDLAEDDLQTPRGVISEALHQRSELFAMSFDPSMGRKVNPSETVVALQLRSVVCVPLLKIRLGESAETRVLSAKQDTIGVLYMDTRRAGANLIDGAKEVLQTLAIEISSVLENARLLDEERKKHQLEQELNIARDIQQALLPPQMPADGWLQAAGSSQACFQVGGDYFDVIEITPDRWGFVLADVSGKGVSAALLTSLLQGAFFSAAAGSQSLSESVARINAYVSARSRHARFATAFCATLRQDGAMRWVNAGHCAGLLARAGGAIEWLEPTACPIGLFADAEFASKDLKIEHGDRLVLYSDGVSEAASFSNERYGEKRLGDFVQANRGLTPQEL